MSLPQPIIQSITLSLLQEHQIALDVKRDDLIDPVISGNKLFKLQEHLKAFNEQKKGYLITFGGAFSNHLHATAYTGFKLGIKTVGFVRAEAHELKNPTPTLVDCMKWGMILEPVSRSEYTLKQESQVIKSAALKYPNAYWVPEGGSGELGVKGAELILAGVDQSKYDVIVLACGTGTSLAGVIRASKPSVQVIGVPVLKGAKWMYEEVQSYLPECQSNWSLKLDYHFSGYGKWNSSLLDFISDIQTKTELPLEPVYTGKAFYAVLDLIKQNKIEKGSRILFLHTGGLQGQRS